MLEVLDPGPLTTVQDGGRPGFGHLGVPASGACDPLGLAVANLVLGNEPVAAALEVTFGGLSITAREDTTVGLGGADLGAAVDGQPVPPGRSIRLRAGQRLAFSGAAADGRGFRAYLALPGGIDVPVVLGSRSTCLVGRFGGLDGRPLRSGDMVRALATDRTPPERAWPSKAAPSPAHAAVIRTLPGPADPDGALLGALAPREWTVTPASDRMGLRLDGQPLPSPPGTDAGAILTHGVTWGSVQVPPDGWPIVLLADAQPTGGYPVVAVAIVADRPVLGQLRPGSTVRLLATTEQEARAALRAQHDALDAVARALADDAGWDELWRSAGAHP